MYRDCTESVMTKVIYVTLKHQSYPDDIKKARQISTVSIQIIKGEDRRIKNKAHT